MGTRGQVSMEYMFGFGFMLLLLLVLLVFIFDRNRELGEAKVFLDKKSECLKFSALLNSLTTAGDGAEAHTSTPYFVTIFNTSLINVREIANISSENLSAKPGSDVTCTFTGISPYYQFTGPVTLRNVQNRITISNETA